MELMTLHNHRGKAWKSVLGPHADEAGMLQVLIIIIGGLAHRLRPRR